MSREVSQDLLGINSVPSDINGFIEKLYPNMLAYASKITKHHQNYEDWVADYAVYILSPNQQGQSRYLAYDPTYGIEYYRWILSSLRAFITSKLYGEAKNYKFVSTSGSSGDDDAVPGFMDEDAVSFSLSDALSIADPFESVDLYKKLTVVAGQIEEVSAQGKGLFYQRLPDFFSRKVMGETNSEIAREYKVSPSAICQWSTRLGDLLKSLGFHFEDYTTELN